MASSRDIKNLGGRPATGKGTPVLVRLQPDQLALLERWIAANGVKISRPEAVRRLMIRGLEAEAAGEDSLSGDLRAAP